MRHDQFKKITEWQNRIFGAATPLSKLEHLKQEVKELESDLKSNSEDKKLEFADCFILLFGAAASDGMSYTDIVDAINEKMKINYRRKWGKPDEKGVVNHIN
jgi:NTP pyrophosphatase (non-canonical NTP hydrolase)